MRNVTCFASMVLLASASAACSVSSSASSASTPGAEPPPQSSDLLVGQMSASISAQAESDGLFVYAALLTDGGTFVELGDGDYFTATLANGDNQVLVREPDDGGSIHYKGSFPATTAATDVTVAFVRPAGRAGAPASKVHVPAPFAITSAPPVQFHRGDVLTATIDPPDIYDAATMLPIVEISGPCIDTGASDVAATISNGAVTAATKDVKPANGAGSGCAVNLRVELLTNGTLDPAYKAGFGITAQQARDLRSAIAW